MIWLGTAASGRDNNLNLIRMTAATAVLVSHAWLVTVGPGANEPLQSFAGYSLGRLAVYVFFAIPGLLITASFTRSSSPWRFVLARALRLFPALIVSMLLVAFLLGPIVTSLPFYLYFSDPNTWIFTIRNTTLVWPQNTLPGVFESNPYPYIESSIWTLIHEVACYVLVFIIGTTGFLRKGKPMLLVLFLYLMGWFVTTFLDLPIHPRILLLQHLSLPFVLGMVAWIWRDSIALSGYVVIALAIIALALRGTFVAYPALIGFLAYASFWLAYVPEGWIRRYNRFGDYSYGMYIYAFPLQGLVVWLFGATGPVLHIALALPITLIASIISWHFIESPSLDLRKRGKPMHRKSV